MSYILTPNCRFCNNLTESIKHLLTDCAETQTYPDSHDLSFAILVLEKPENTIHIAKFDVWIRNVMTNYQKPPAFRTAMIVKAMTEDTGQEEKEKRMNPREYQKLVAHDASLKTTISTSKIQRGIGNQYLKSC
eukprot:5082202-Ditylum_brightwellii.AAC.1